MTGSPATEPTAVGGPEQTAAGPGVQPRSLCPSLALWPRASHSTLWAATTILCKTVAKTQGGYEGASAWHSGGPQPTNAHLSGSAG